MVITNDKYCVYAHINKTNGKIYIGQTCQNPSERWKKGKGYKGCILFDNAIQKYGWDNFEHEVIASNLTLQEANHFEELLIDILDTMNPNKGYNLRSGGENCTYSNEIKQKMKENHFDARGQNNPFYGKHHTDETKQKMKKHHADFRGQNNPRYGKHLSEETKRKLSEANKGKNAGENHCWYGKHLPDEMKAHISEALKGKYCGVNSPRATRINQYDLGGNFIKCWNYIGEASNELHIIGGNIGACCRGKRKSAGGFIWRYADDVTPEEVAV